jgi:hypothetical protein
MTFFLESPWPVIGVGILVEVVLGLILWQTGRGVLLWAMGGVLLLVLGGLLLERLVVTEKERIEATLDGAAAAVEANDLDRVNTYLAADAAEPRTLARWALDRVTFTKVKITRIEITINRLTSPPAAKAEVSGYVSLRDRKGEYPYENHPLSGTVELRQDGNRWLVTGYKLHDDPRKR